MTVYVDNARIPFRHMIVCHMMAEDTSPEGLKELHAMADAIWPEVSEQKRRSWFQNKKGHMPHYDISLSKKALAIEHGAVECEPEKVVELIRAWRELEKARQSK